MKRIVVTRALHIHACLALVAFCYSSSLRADMPAESLAGESAMKSNSFYANSVSPVTVPSVTWHDDFEQGWKQSRQTGRPMLIFITSERCHYCDAMKRDTWCNESVARSIKDKFVAIRLSPQRNARILERINIPAFPMTLIGHPQGKIIAKRVGYQPPEEIHGLFDSAVSR